MKEESRYRQEDHEQRHGSWETAEILTQDACGR